MTRHRLGLCLALGFGLLALACEPNLAVPPGNRVPTADARVLGQTGQNATVDYMGVPLKVTLDGSASVDLDGSIKKYRWLSGRRKPGTGGAAGSGGAGAAGAAGMSANADADSGMPDNDLFIEQRWVPAGAPPDWPDDVMQPLVELTEGEYAFVLWVEDNKSVQSLPSTLKVTVRTPLSPEAQMCVDNVLDTVPTACKTCLCSISPECITMSNETVCGSACWAFLRCIATKCPTYVSGGDTSCLAANCAAEATAPGASAGAMAIGACVRMCPTQCRSM